MKNENLKVARNIVVLLVLAWPCVLVFVDSIFLNFLGVFYIVEYWRVFLRPIYRKYKEMCMMDE